MGRGSYIIEMKTRPTHPCMSSSKETLFKPPIEEVMATGSLESQKGRRTRRGRVRMKK